MDANETRHGIRDATRRWLVPVVLVVAGVVAGGTIAGGIASAASSSNGGSGSASAAAHGSGAPPADMGHGPGETLLTGSTADEVTAAAEAAVPNATVIRVETDSEGSAYEAHVQKADGSVVTVKVDASFKVTSTEDGFGGTPRAPSSDGSA